MTITATLTPAEREQARADLDHDQRIFYNAAIEEALDDIEREIARIRRIAANVPTDHESPELALELVEACYGRCGNAKAIRLHGDCHPGNILWTADGPHFVDLDDSRMGPAMQDLWMLLSGDRAAMSLQLRAVLDGYEQFMEFDRKELNLLEALRTLRLIHYSAWIARRWDDPAFPAAFPWFDSQRFWQDKILELREQIALMQEEPLAVG